MFNFKTLKLCHPEEDSSLSSFVGIRRNKQGELEFRLPRGFSEFPVDDFDQTKRLFFRLYSTFKKFKRDSTRDILDQRAAGKDNAEKQGNGYRFKDKEDNDVILYSKIALIENLLDVYRDLALDVMERRIGRDEKIDFSKIEHYLHRAVYLPNHVIFIDEMDLPRQTLQYEATTLIDLFCFILSELQTELEQEIDTRVQELAHRFSEQHLNHDQSLFNEETFEITIQTLKDVLDDVDKHTAYKDDDYWRLYEAIELFLYGELDMEEPHEDGTYWGINNFSSVWEDMCVTYAFANFDVIYADTNIIFNGERIANAKSAGFFPIFKKPDFDDPFFIEFRFPDYKRRWMRPDLIRDKADPKLSKIIFYDLVKIIETKSYQNTLDFIVKPISDDNISIFNTFCSNLKSAVKNKHIHGVRIIGDNTFKNSPKNELEIEKNTPAYKIILEKKNEIALFDWKYMGINCFIDSNSKIYIDITKQLCYEFALKKVKPSNLIESQFIIPWFYTNPEKLEEDIGDDMDDKLLHSRLQDNKIKVFKANFSKIQSVYLSHD